MCPVMRQEEASATENEESKHLKVIDGYVGGRIRIEEATWILWRTPRSVYRMITKVREKGPEGVLHGNRNKVRPKAYLTGFERSWRDWPLGNTGISTTHIFVRSLAGPRGL